MRVPQFLRKWETQALPCSAPREAADKVVLHTGKYEELIVCSHEIAASTAQLVAASKVKANKDSRHLSRLQECSRTVNVMAANVVASTKSGQEQIEDRGDGQGPGSGWGGGLGTDTYPSLATDTMDFSGMSLIKLKKQEMETQVGAHADPTATGSPGAWAPPRLSRS